MVVTKNKNRHADEVEHHRRYIHHVVFPGAPPGEEAVEVAEDFFGPKINATFAGITLGEFNHRDALGPEEKKQRDDPKPNRHAAVGGDRRNDVKVENGHDEEED